MNQNEELGRWILAKGWLNQQIIAEAWESSHSSGIDLCEALVRKGALSSDQAQFARSAINPSAKPSSTTAIAPPQYEVLKELGRGGMGVVFLARHKLSGASCVIKLMLNERPSLDAVARFEREAHTLAQFKHRSIVGIKEYGSWNGLPFFVMDHIDGADLKSYVDDHIAKTGEVPDYEWTRKVFISITEALIICHKKDVIHRDLKPHNILIEKETQNPILVDFGLAGQLQFNGEQESLTKTGQSIGTPAFMAPEQVEARGNFGDMNQSTDVWGLVATLYYCLTGQPPYSGSTAINIISQLMKKPPVPPIHINKSIPPWLNAICSDSMQQKQNRRPNLETILQRLKEPNLNTRAPWPLWTKKALKLFAFLIFLGFCVAVLYGLAQISKDRTPPVIRLNKVSTDCGKSFLLSGEIEEDTLKDVYLQYLKTEQRVSITVTKGQFRATIPSLPGRKDYQLVAIDSNGNQTKESFTTVGHHEAPPLSVTKDHNGPIRQVMLTIRTAPDSDIQVKVADRIRKFKGPQISVTERLKRGLNTIQITATDPYKNTTVIEETINSNQFIYTVGATPPDFGDRHYGDLSYAIKKASRTRASVVILPGVYKKALDLNIPSLRKDSQLKIIGLPTPKSPVVIESNEDITVRVKSGNIVFQNILIRNTQLSGRGAVLYVVKGSVELRDCVLESPSKEKNLVSSSKDPNANVTRINMTRCDLKGGYNGVFLGPNSRATLSHCKVRQASKQLILIEDGQFDAQDTEFRGGLSAVKSSAENYSKIEINRCVAIDQSSHVFEIAKNSGLRVLNSTIDHKAKGQIAFWARQKNKITVRDTKILNEGGLCFCSTNNALIEVSNCVFENPHTIGKSVSGALLRMVDCTARSIRDTGFNIFERGRLELVRCQLIKGRRAALSLCDADSQTSLEDCVIRGFSQALLLNSPKALNKVEVKGCRFEDSKFIAVEIRGEIGVVKFKDTKIANNDLGMFIERKNKQGGATQLSIDNCEFKGNKTQALLLSGPNIFLKLNNCQLEGNGRFKSTHWGRSAIFVGPGSRLEIRGGRIEKNEGPAFNDHRGRIKIFPGVKIGENKEKK